jgi:hypothetical protein
MLAAFMGWGLLGVTYLSDPRTYPRIAAGIIFIGALLSLMFSPLITPSVVDESPSSLFYKGQGAQSVVFADLISGIIFQYGCSLVGIYRARRGALEEQSRYTGSSRISNSPLPLDTDSCGQPFCL